ncbi:MAG: hypothetical protein NTX76_00965 [Alphaproteobacteria bacterium]|nr:hypothetical protein [Alphaproteobacteria bacterium]
MNFLVRITSLLLIASGVGYAADASNDENPAKIRKLVHQEKRNAPTDGLDILAQAVDLKTVSQYGLPANNISKAGLPLSPIKTKAQPEQPKSDFLPVYQQAPFQAIKYPYITRENLRAFLRGRAQELLTNHITFFISCHEERSSLKLDRKRFLRSKYYLECSLNAISGSISDIIDNDPIILLALPLISNPVFLTPIIPQSQILGKRTGSQMNHTPNPDPAK